MSDRPYDERPAARPEGPVASEPPSGASSLSRRRGWCFPIGIFVVGLVILGIALVNMNGKPTKATMLDDCRTAVSEWAGIDVDEVTGKDRSQGTAGWDFEGTYPGGEWGCGGPAGEAKAKSIIVFPGGAGAEGTVPESIR